MQFNSFFVTIDRLMPPHFPHRILLALIFFILLIQGVAVHWHLYFHFWWLDIPMHILGSLWVALFGLVSYYSSPYVKEKDHSVVFVASFAIALSMTIGLLWEIYEFAVEHAVGDSGAGLFDTLTDMSNVFIGSIFATWIFIRFGYNKKA